MKGKSPKVFKEETDLLTGVCDSLKSGHQTKSLRQREKIATAANWAAEGAGSNGP